MIPCSKTLLAAALAGGAVLLAACGGDDSDGGGGKTLSPEVIAEANEYFTNTCVSCHGTGGQGDGPGSASLNPKPRNYTDKAWQKQVTDEYLGKIIVYGGTAVGKSATMPGNPQLASKPDVVAALVAKIRGYAN